MCLKPCVYIISSEIMRKLESLLILIAVLSFYSVALESDISYEDDILNDAEPRGFIAFANVFNKTSIVSTINSTFNLPNKFQSIYNFTTDKLSSLSSPKGVKTLILKSLAFTFIGLPVLAFCLYFILVLLFPDPVSDSKFERDVSLVVQHMGKIASSVENGVFDLLEDLTDPGKGVLPEGYAYNDNNYLTMVNHPQKGNSGYHQIGSYNRLSYNGDLPHKHKGNPYGSNVFLGKGTPVKNSIHDATSAQRPNFFDPKYQLVQPPDQVPNYFQQQQQLWYRQQLLRHKQQQLELHLRQQSLLQQQQPTQDLNYLQQQSLLKEQKPTQDLNYLQQQSLLQEQQPTQDLNYLQQQSLLQQQQPTQNLNYLQQQQSHINYQQQLKDLLHYQQQQQILVEQKRQHLQSQQQHQLKLQQDQPSEYQQQQLNHEQRLQLITPSPRRYSEAQVTSFSLPIDHKLIGRTLVYNHNKKNPNFLMEDTTKSTPPMVTSPKHLKFEKSKVSKINLIKDNSFKSKGLINPLRKPLKKMVKKSFKPSPQDFFS